MKIALYGQSPMLKTGLGKLLFNTAHSLVALEHEVTAFCFDHQEMVQKPFRVFPFNDKTKSQCKSVIENEQFDLIISICDLWAAVDIYEIVSRLAIPWVSYMGVEGLSYPEICFKSYKDQIHLGNMFNLLAGVWCFTEESKKVILKEKLHDNVDVLPLSIDPIAIGNAPPFKLRELLKIPDGKKVIGYIGDNIHRKGIDLFFQFVKNHDCVGYVHSQSLKLSFGYDLPEMRRVMGLEDKIFLKDDLGEYHHPGLTDSELYGLYKSFDLFFHPHRAEGFGLCVLEALTAGVPTLATDCSGPSTFLPDNCKIEVDHTFYNQLGGVGYVCSEPAMNYYCHTKLSKLIRKSIHQFHPKGLTNFDFVNTLRSLLEKKYEPKFYRRIS